MNYLILSCYDSMYRSEALVISEDKMDYYYLKEDERKQLMDEDKCWFDMDNVKDYLNRHDLLPCNVIDCTDGTADITYIDEHSC